MFKKRDKWHDGYFIDDQGYLQFYRQNKISKKNKGKPIYGEDDIGESILILPEKQVEKVHEDKILQYESMCATYHDKFLESGMLRLNTPLNIHQEHLGTDFLFVPMKYRKRIKDLIGQNHLVMDGSVKSYRAVPNNKKISFEEILGSGVIEEPSSDNPINIDDPEENRFFIRQFQIEGMFKYYKNVS